MRPRFATLPNYSRLFILPGEPDIGFRGRRSLHILFWEETLMNMTTYYTVTESWAGETSLRRLLTEALRQLLEEL